MSEPRDWPFERPAKGTLRPWFVSVMGYVAVLFRDGEEARRAQQGLLERGVPESDIRLYDSQQILGTVSRFQEERSPLARAVAALTVDRRARERYLGNARAGGSALWLYAPSEEQADRLIQLLTEYNYALLHYYGDEGVEVIHRDAD